MTGDVFKVNETSGEVVLIKPLDRERQATITVIVSVLDDSDTRNDPLLETRRRTIIVEDVDDSWPTYQPHKNANLNGAHSTYQVELSEQTPINSIVVGEIIATDADEGVNAEIVFECRARQSTNQACDVFSIESRRLGTGKYSATIKTKVPLDYEQVQSYKLSLVARGKRPSPIRGMPLETDATININLLNVQDEGPVFMNAPYSLSIEENRPLGTRLLPLTVQDGDSAPQRELSVIVAPGMFNKYFRVVKDFNVPNLWYLETGNDTIDREDPIISKQGNMFTISLLAAELEENSLPLASDSELSAVLEDPNYTSKLAKVEQVTIVVLDLPDTRPQFVQVSTGRSLEENLLVLNISESIVTGASVPNLDLEVQDLDQGMNSRFNLTLVDSDPNGPSASMAFGLESNIIYGKAEVVLNILNASLLDYENPKFRVYKFSLVASKMSLVKMLEVQVNIMDANDNLPEFERNQYTLEVAEGSPPGTLVSIIRAKDKDSGAFGKVDYNLRGPGASKFKLISGEGKILVNDCGHLQCLDYETQPSYSLNYEARDGGGRIRNVSVLIQVIDINDHAPKFLEPIYKRELISDNLSSKQSYISPQLLVKAKDLDGPTQGRNSITYRIKSSNLTSLAVNPTNGLVYLSQPLDLSTFSESSSLSPTQAPGQSYSTANANRKMVFEAEVLAEDNGNPPLNSTAKILLVVKSNRDGAPQFKQDLYQVQVKESQPILRPFFQVQAIDPDEKDSQLRYSASYDLNDLISVDAITGELAFKSRVDYDDFKGEPYNVTLIATDNNRPYPLQATTLVSIQILDVNNKAPKFMEKEYRATLSQGRTKAGDLVMQVQASDLDTTAQLNYSINTDHLLVVDRNGQSFTLDELVNSMQGYLAQMNRFERQHLVASLKSLFTIDRRTGAIMLKHEPDYSFAASIMIQVNVVDLQQEVDPAAGPTGRQRDQVNCTFFLQNHIDRNPIFAPPWTIEKRVYNVSMLEELPIGTSIFSLLAKDPLTSNRIDNFEKVAQSDPNDLFRVDKSGVVYVNKRIDYEEIPLISTGGNSNNNKRLTIQVKAINDEFYSTADLIIQVVDLNDNAPQFKQSNYSISVSESVTYPTDLLTVQAEDRDSAEFSQVFYTISGYSSQLFTINSKRGIIGLKKGVALDRDSEASHSILVTASDCNETRYLELQAVEMQTTKLPLNNYDLALPGCRKSSVFVTINLLDENDNEPQFMNVNKRGEFEALTSETVAKGSIITQVRATDLDEGLNGQVAYEIVRADDQVSQLLKIDQEGYLSANESLSGLGRSSPYRITIRAFDHGKVPRESYAIMLLSISDVVANDGVPKFIRPKVDEVVQLSESVGPSTFVYQVQAIDPDEEANGKIMYKFVPEKSGQDIFEIDPFTGIIKTQYRPNFYLDREQVPNYTLIILAHDLGSPPKQAHQVLTIKIMDVNDNEPYFDRQIDDPPVVLYTEEEMPRGHLIGTIQAIDKDIGDNALIGYTIIDGNENNLFKLSFDPEELRDSHNNTTNSSFDAGNNPCRIYSTGKLDRETRESYTLTIKAGSLTKLKNQFLHQYRDPLGGRNPLNHYNASDLTKIRVTIKLLDINDNRPVFLTENAKTVVDSTAEIYSQLMVFRAQDADSSNPEIQYSIVDALYYSDSKFKSHDNNINNLNEKFLSPSYQPTRAAAMSMRHVFDIDSRSGILRNAVSLRPYIDGYFEVFVKADSGSYSQLNVATSSELQPPVELDSTPQVGQSYLGARRGPDYVIDNKCYNSSDSGRFQLEINKLPAGIHAAETDNCYTTVTKAIVFITHQRETFRFVFNKTKLNDRLDEFKAKVQFALEEFMFEPSATNSRQRDLQVEASTSLDASAGGGAIGHSRQPVELPKAEKVYLNTFNTDFYEREDGSMDFSTVTSCSQLVKFDDRGQSDNGGGYSGSSSMQVPNQVINYEEVIKLMKSLNETQTRDRKFSLFNQYGLVNIERCLPDRATYRMTLSERLSIYLASMIAVVGLLLAYIVSRKRKSYEKNLKLLQRSKYQYMGQYATLASGMQAAAAAAAAATINRAPQGHQMSMGSLGPNGGATMNGNGNYHSSYVGQHLASGNGGLDAYDGPSYDTWQL